MGLDQQSGLGHRFPLGLVFPMGEEESPDLRYLINPW